MSVTKTQATDFSVEDQPVKFQLSQLNIKSIEKKQNIKLHCVLRGSFDGTGGEVDKKKVNLDLQDILDGFTSAEIKDGKAFLAAVERVAAAKDADLASETHDDSDVF